MAPAPKPKPAANAKAKSNGKPGFFDDYVDIGGGGHFLKSQEKLDLIEQGVPFKITAIHEDPDNEYGPRYIAFCQIPNSETGEDEEKKIGFPTDSGVNSRDAMLRAMKDFLDSDDAEPVLVKLSKPGRAIMIVAA